MDYPLTETSHHQSSNSPKTFDLFQWMPIPSLIVDKKGAIQDINQQALEFFGTQTREVFLDKNNFKSLVIDLSQSVSLLVELKSSSDAVTKKILLRRLDNSVKCVDIYARLFPNDPNLFLFQFTEASTKDQVLLKQIMHVFRLEIHRLKPYLNRPGKELLEQIIHKNALENVAIEPGRNQYDIVSEERINRLVELFPKLTSFELALCGFLSLKLTFDEIAGLTGKTSNCLRVSFHRILGKTNMNSGKEFIRKLESVK